MKVYKESIVEIYWNVQRDAFLELCNLNVSYLAIILNDKSLNTVIKQEKVNKVLLVKNNTCIKIGISAERITYIYISIMMTHQISSNVDTEYNVDVLCMECS
jgi:hypothetical protein